MSIYISASLLTDYLSCHRKPMFRINNPELAIQNKEMIIGIAVHYALEKHWNDSKAALDYVQDYMQLHNINIPEDVNYGIHCTTMFFNNFRPHLSSDDLIEYRFKLPLQKDTFLVGKIDRISNKNIFDWKTTRKAPTKLINDLQFLIYEYAYKQCFNENPTGSYYGSLINGSLIKHRNTEEAHEFLFGELIPEVIDSIKNGKFTHTGYFSRSCFRCPYKTSCIKEEEYVVDRY